MKFSLHILSGVLFIFLNFIPRDASAQTSWMPVTTPVLNTLYGISYADRNTWVAVGAGGTILRSTDAGLSWLQISSPSGDDLRSVSFKDSIGIAAGISGRILRSSNSGSSWSLESRITTKNLYSISMGKYSAVIGGHEGTILYSTDNGITWNPRTAGTASEIFGLSIFDSTAVGACGQGAVIMSVNSGNAWGLTVLGNNLTFFYGVSFVNSKTGWMVGTSLSNSSLILRSDQSGFVWNLQSSPVPDALNSVSFLSSDTGTAVGTNGAIIHTINGGTDWLKQSSGTNKTLNGVSLYDSKLGIAVGDSGTILRTENPGILSIKSQPSLKNPEAYLLGQNFPNPFNPTTTIDYSLPMQGLVTIKVYNLIGKEIETLVNEQKAAGNYSLKFDGSSLSSGVYFYTMKTGNFTQTRKFILMK